MSDNTDDLDPQSVPTDFIKEGSDWLATFNPNVPRQMDVKLLNKLVHEKVVGSVKFSADAGRLAVGSDGVVIVYDLTVGQMTTFTLGVAVDADSHETNPNTHNYVRGVSFSPDGKWLAAGSEDKLVRIWSLGQNMLLHTLRGHRSEVYALEFSSDGSLLVSASGDRTIRLWDTTSLGTNTSSSLTVEDSCRVLVPADDPNKSKVAFTCVAVSHKQEPDGQEYVAAGSLDGAIRIWDIQRENGEKMVERLRGHGDSVYSVKFVSGVGGGGLGLVSGALDKTLKRWDLRFDETAGSGGHEGDGERGSTCVKTLRGHKDYVLATATVREGQNLRAASASRDGSVRLWDLKTGMAQFSIQGHKNTVTSVDLSSDGKLLVSGSGDSEVRIWSYTII